MTLSHHLRDLFNFRRDRSGFFPLAPDAAPVISPARALEVFDELRAMDNVSHAYIDDGCAPRAHLMCHKLAGMKLLPEKGWAFETPKRDLVVDFPHGQQIWWFHVTPVLRVGSDKGGAEPMAFDTVLFDGPATMDEWRRVMNAEPEQIHITPVGKAPKGYHGDYRPYIRTGLATDAAAQKRMFDYLSLEKEPDFIAPQVFPSSLRWRLTAASPAADTQIPRSPSGRSGPA